MSLDYGRALALYVPPLDKMIHHLKYRRKTAIAKFLGLGMANVMRTDHYLKKADIIIPVPLYWLKGLRRGYNQSRLLALQVARECGIGIQDALVRVKNTRTQTRLSDEGRTRNVRDAFKLRSDNVQDRIVVLVDDVMTTGATIKECARVLKRSGARRVYSLVAAVTPA
jgi:ComF family protein